MTPGAMNLRAATVGFISLIHPAVIHELPAQATINGEARVVIDSEGWRLVGTLRMPTVDGPLPAVLMLNKAAGDRSPYGDLARHLADRGIASLRLDLRGHGESTNLGSFAPGRHERDPLVWDAERDVTTALEYLKSHPRIDGEQIGIVGASYSGEEMSEAGRLNGFAQAYVALSPGSFSEESIRAIDSSGVPWLFVTSRDDRFLRQVTGAVQSRSRIVELAIVPGTRHATDILLAHPDMAERIAVWLARRLR